MSQNRNALDKTKLKTRSQRLARMHSGPTKGESMR
jgi:hypothetical protein